MNYVIQENHGEIALPVLRPTRPGPHQSREPVYKLISPCPPHQSLYSLHWIFRQHCLVSKNLFQQSRFLRSSLPDLYSILYNIFLAQKMSGKQVTNTGTNSQVSHKLSIPWKVWTLSQGSGYRAYSDGGYAYSNPGGSRYYNTGSGHAFYRSWVSYRAGNEG